MSDSGYWEIKAYNQETQKEVSLMYARKSTFLQSAQILESIAEILECNDPGKRLQIEYLKGIAGQLKEVGEDMT